jgi:hypothetical protein
MSAGGPGTDRLGNGQTDERGAGLGETSEVGVEGPVQASKPPCRSDYWSISSWQL